MSMASAARLFWVFRCFWVSPLRIFLAIRLAPVDQRQHGIGVAEVGVLGHLGCVRPVAGDQGTLLVVRSEEHTSELQSLMRISYAVFCLKKQTINRSKGRAKNPPTKLT